MARQYGNKVGKVPVPSVDSAFGVWMSPTEVNRQVGLTQWPKASSSSSMPSFTGAYAFALTLSGAQQAVSNSWLVCSGQEVSRSTYASLFSLISTTYGSGNGSTTFRIPHCSDFDYIRTVVTSGLTIATLSGDAQLPTHIHEYNSKECVGGGGNNAGGSNTGCGSAVVVSGFSSLEGSVNRARHRQAYPLICTSDSLSYPDGCVFPVLIPTTPSGAISSLPSQVLVCSGQSLAKNSFPKLFSVLSTQFGSGFSPPNTFTLPDLRGLFIENVSIHQVPQTSGVLPSGYILDDFARHRHQASGTFTIMDNNSDSPVNNQGGSNRANLISPGTTSVGVGEAVESRGDNICALLCVLGV